MTTVPIGVACPGRSKTRGTGLQIPINGEGNMARESRRRAIAQAMQSRRQNWLLSLLQSWENKYEVLTWANTICEGLDKDRLCRDVGAVINWRHLRDHLLTINQGSRYGSRDFLCPNEIADSWGGIEMESFPEELEIWQTKSRRIVRLDQDLRVQLGATAFNRVRVADLQFPFDSFAIELDPPFESVWTGQRAEPGRTAEFCQNHLILVTLIRRPPRAHQVRLRLIGTRKNSSPWEGISNEQRLRINELIRTRKFGQAKHEYEKVRRQVTHPSLLSTLFIFDMPSGGEPVVSWADSIWNRLPDDSDIKTPEAFEELKYSLRVLIGYLMYIKTPKGAAQQHAPYNPYGNAKRSNRDAIVNSWEVCDVHSFVKIDAATIAAFAARENWRRVNDRPDAPDDEGGEGDDADRDKRRSPIAHFRSGTWVFAGVQEEGGDTEAEAILIPREPTWRSPSFVCPWNLPEGKGLPLGAFSAKTLQPPKRP